jgi:hypothetical protein
MAEIRPTDGERWQNGVDQNFATLFRYHEEDRRTLGEIQGQLKVLTSRTLPCGDHESELETVKADVGALKTFKTITIWVGMAVLAALGCVGKVAVSALAAATIKWR